MGATGHPDEDAQVFYVVRFFSFVLILIAIAEKKLNKIGPDNKTPAVQVGVKRQCNGNRRRDTCMALLRRLRKRAGNRPDLVLGAR